MGARRNHRRDDLRGTAGSTRTTSTRLSSARAASSSRSSPSRSRRRPRNPWD